MKKFKTMMAMMLALVSMCVAFSSCSSDDDDNNGAGSSATAEQVVGTYVGETMSIALAGQGDMDPLENATFKLEKVDDSHVNITLPAFGSAPMALPSITVKNLAVTESNGTYSIPETSFDQTLENGKGLSKSAIKATIKDGKMQITFVLKYGIMPFVMNCSSNATKK